jgi:hypothetical protein
MLRTLPISPSSIFISLVFLDIHIFQDHIINQAVRDGISPRTSGFRSGGVHVQYVVDELRLVQVSSLNT